MEYKSLLPEQLRAVFVRPNVDQSFVFPMFEQAQIPSLRNVFMHSSLDVPRRVLEAWQAGAQEQLIAIASVEGDQLWVRDCALNMWKVPFNSIPALSLIPEKERANFEIDEDGSYIYWPSSDIHLDMEALRSAVDPELREKLAAERVVYDRRFGQAVAEVRKAHKLQQTDIPGISERHIRRIEKEGYRSKLETLKKLAQAHGLSLNEYLEEVAQTLSGT